MRHYHIRWLLAISYTSLGFVLLLLAVGSFVELPRYLCSACMGAFLLAAITWCTRNFCFFTLKDDINKPNSAEGIAVHPSGKRLNDNTPLEIGTRVLALSHGKWHQAVIIGIRSRDRVLIHFRGWSNYWDEVYRRSDLQLDLAQQTSEREYSVPSLNTAIMGQSVSNDSGSP